MIVTICDNKITLMFNDNEKQQSITAMPTIATMCVTMCVTTEELP